MTIRTTENRILDDKKQRQLLPDVYHYYWYDTVLSAIDVTYILNNKEDNRGKSRIISIEWTIYLSTFNKATGTYNQAKEYYLTNALQNDLFEDYGYGKMKRFLMKNYPDYFIWEEREFINNL